MKWILVVAVLASFAIPFLAGWQQTQRAGKTLRTAAGSRLQIGVAVNTGLLGDAAYTGLIAREFNSATAENCMKPASILKAPGQYDFAETDRFIEFAERNGMQVIGHTLVWHSQSPRFLFEDAEGKPLAREVALKNMKDYITTVVGRYRGRIKGWDVVNEAVSDGGGLRPTPALKAIGEDYLVKAFQFAAEADPNAELYYNDYNIDMDYKRPSGLELVRKLRDAGARIDAVGIQGHYMLTSDMNEIRRGVKAYLDEGFKVMITELDVDVLPRSGQGGADVSAIERNGMNPYVNGLPEEKQTELAAKYEQLFDFFLAQPNITRITFWGSTDAHTWLNGFPVRGRTNHPLLFDRKNEPKPAYFRVLEALSKRPPLPDKFAWESSDVVVPVPKDPARPVVSIKDPTIVHDGTQYHLFATVARPKGGWQMAYLKFSDWESAKRAAPTFLDDVNPHLKGYHCAPQVFYFRPHKKWYLIYQSQQPQYSTTTDIANPASWSAPQDFFPTKPTSVPGLWIDYWVICDDAHAYLFFTGDDGRLYRSRTAIADFPSGMSDPVVVLQDPDRFRLFEASCHYKLKGSDYYLTIIEALGKDGVRYYRSWVAKTLDGNWSPLADSWEAPFAGKTNVKFASGSAWTDDISHGELLRDDVDETMTVNPERLEFLYQGRPPTTEKLDYLLLPYRLGLLRQIR